jgi:hypothetical protein
MNEYTHLRADRRNLANLANDVRIALIQRGVWVDYEPAETIFKMINNMAEARGRISAPCLLVVGEGGSGKTAIINQMKKRIKKSEGLVYVSMAEDPEIKTKKNFRMELARAMELPTDTPSFGRPGLDLPREISEVIRLRGKWGIVIDELHDALLRNKTDQRLTLSMLKRLSGEEFGVSIIGFGTAAASNALNFNHEFKRRFYQYQLKDWKETSDFRSFLFELEEWIPLREPSFLYQEELMNAILIATGGRMDSVIELIQNAGAFAIKLGKERIDIEILSKTIANPWLY